jgi:hypothetical protein
MFALKDGSKETALTSILAAHTEKFIIDIVSDMDTKITEESNKMNYIGIVQSIPELIDLLYIEDLKELLDTLDRNIVLNIVQISKEFV